MRERYRCEEDEGRAGAERGGDGTTADFAGKRESRTGETGQTGENPRGHGESVAPRARGDGEVAQRGQSTEDGPPGRAEARAGGQQRQYRLGGDQRDIARSDEPGRDGVPPRERSRTGERGAGVGGRREGRGDPGEVDVPRRVPVEEDQQQAERGERLGGGGEPAEQGERRYRQHDHRGDGEDRGPADHAEAGPGDRGEHDGGAAQQKPAEDEQHVLHGADRGLRPGRLRRLLGRWLRGRRGGRASFILAAPAWGGW